MKAMCKAGSMSNQNQAARMSNRRSIASRRKMACQTAKLIASGLRGSRMARPKMDEECTHRRAQFCHARFSVTLGTATDTTRRRNFSNSAAGEFAT